MTFLKKKFRKIILGISGGVDSSVAALLLKKSGFEVQAVFMRNWNIVDETGNCSVDTDLKDAEKTCMRLGINLHEVNFSKEYWNLVFCDFIEKYMHGKTPNPDVLCNRYIKFNRFLDYASERFGADAIATGHYARTTFGQFLGNYNKKEGVHLLKAVDSFKDQTLFLSQVYQGALQKTMFPIGLLTKAEVKRIALENSLDHVLQKKESTGICFIGRRKFSKFISEYLPDKQGSFIDIDSGNVIGYHCGVHYWTIGQRCRISGLSDRYYIARIIPETQEILVASGINHPILWSQHVTTDKAHWIHSSPEVLKKGAVLNCDFRFQHTDPLIPCKVMMNPDESLNIIIKEPLFGITPGQFAALYKDEECLGGAQIENTAPSLHTLREYSSFLEKKDNNIKA